MSAKFKPEAGSITSTEGPAGITLLITWGEDPGVHKIELVYPDDMPEDVRRQYFDSLITNLVAAGVKESSITAGESDD